MEKLMAIVLFPIVWPFIAQRIWHKKITYEEMGINVIVVVLLVTGMWFAGTYSVSQDLEVWNGRVTSKDRDHGTYEQSYDCNCRTVSCGKNCSTTQCDTCYETHYTVKWTGNTTVGSVTFDSKDSTSRSVYNSPNPSSYVRCKINEPAAIEHSFTNYVKAVPDSLFHNRTKSKEAYPVPNYPRVHDFYKINRVLSVKLKAQTGLVKDLNSKLNEKLKSLGFAKQVNIIVILTGIDDPAYRHTVENDWLGGKKNDVVIFVGLDGNKITWTDTMTWALNSGNELFHVKMRDRILELKDMNVDTFVPVVTSTIRESFDRPHMKDYEYLSNEIEPPLWVIWMSIIVAIGGSLGLSYVFHSKADIKFQFNRRRFR